MGTTGLLYVKGMGKLKVLRVVVIPVFDGLVMLWLCGQGMTGPVPQRDPLSIIHGLMVVISGMKRR